MNSIAAREDFNTAVQVFANSFNPMYLSNGVPNPNYNPNFDPVNAFRLAQSYIRLEQPATTTTLYNFPVLNNIQNQNAQFTTERRLALQDTFVPTHVGFFLGLPATAALNDTAWKPLTYTNPFILTNATQMERFYNDGTLSITINNVTYITDWDLWRHWKTNQTQQTQALGANAPEDQVDGADRPGDEDEHGGVYEGGEDSGALVAKGLALGGGPGL